MWHHGDLTAAAGGVAPAGPPVAYAFNGNHTQHVVYRGTDNHIHELHWSEHGGWHHLDLTTATLGVRGTLAAGDPVAYAFESNHTMHVVYRGVDNHIYELHWTAARGWWNGDLTAASGAPTVDASGDPAAYAFDSNHTMHVVYRGTDGHIHELHWEGGGGGRWHHGNLTAAAGATRALPAGPPAAYAFDSNGSQHVVYRGADGHIHELHWSRGGGWHHNNLTATAAGTPAATPAGDPAAYAFDSNHSQHVIYRGADGHIHELHWGAAPERGFFASIGAGIAWFFNGVATVVEVVVNAVGEFVGDVLETLGSLLADLFYAIGDLLSGIPWIGGALQGAFHWVGDVVSSALDFVASVVKGVLDLVAGVVAGVARIAGGILSLDPDLILKGVGDVAAGVAGAVILIGGKTIGLIQSVLFLQWGERALTKDEHALLERVFRSSVALYNVRIIEGFAGIYSINDRPFTLGNTIYLKDHSPSAEPWTLVHECVHVWQYQNHGSRYAADALGAQAAPGDEYQWREELVSGNRRWSEFNAEAQGKFIEDVFRFGLGSSGAQQTFFDEDPLHPAVSFVDLHIDHTGLARDATAELRGAQSWRTSGWIKASLRR